MLKLYLAFFYWKLEFHGKNPEQESYVEALFVLTERCKRFFSPKYTKI